MIGRLPTAEYKQWLSTTKDYVVAVLIDNVVLITNTLYSPKNFLIDNIITFPYLVSVDIKESMPIPGETSNDL